MEFEECTQESIVPYCTDAPAQSHRALRPHLAAVPQQHSESRENSNINIVDTPGHLEKGATAYTTDLKKCLLTSNIGAAHQVASFVIRDTQI